MTIPDVTLQPLVAVVSWTPRMPLRPFCSSVTAVPRGPPVVAPRATTEDGILPAAELTTDDGKAAYRSQPFMPVSAEARPASKRVSAVGHMFADLSAHRARRCSGLEGRRPGRLQYIHCLAVASIFSTRSYL